jgi:magnesium-transporting ATPase (P-type)
MVEKMACVKDLCVDKTGTLRNNDMTVVAIICEGKPFEKQTEIGQKRKDKQEEKRSNFADEVGTLSSCKILSECVLVNSTVITYIHKNHKQQGDPTKQIKADEKPKN